MERKLSDRVKQIGELLDNGAIILMKNSKVVLAYREKSKEFVTWMFSANGSTEHGHYFGAWGKDTKDMAFKEAVEDYFNR